MGHCSKKKFKLKVINFPLSLNAPRHRNVIWVSFAHTNLLPTHSPLPCWTCNASISLVFKCKINSSRFSTIAIIFSSICFCWDSCLWDVFLMQPIPSIQTSHVPRPKPTTKTISSQSHHNTSQPPGQRAKGWVKINPKRHMFW